jgi:hypothetical protein
LIEYKGGGFGSRPVSISLPLPTMNTLSPTFTLKPQDIAFDHEQSCNYFAPTTTKPFVATPSALKRYGQEAIVRCLGILQGLAEEHQGLDYLQVFLPTDGSEPLWFIEDGDGGAITALLPSDY